MGNVGRLAGGGGGGSHNCFLSPTCRYGADMKCANE